MNVPVLLSLVSVAVFTAAAVVLVWRRRNANLYKSVFAPLLLSILLYDFIVVSNALEHYGITSFFDPMEDIAEVVFTLTFLFFVNNWRKERSKTRFRELFKHTPVPLAEVARDGRILELNDRMDEKLNDLFGQSSQKARTMEQLWELALPDPKARAAAESLWQRDVETAYKTNGLMSFKEREFFGKDGTKRTVIIGGNIIGGNLLFSLIDITDRKQAEMEREKLQLQLLQAQKLEAVGVLVGGIAHDFNNMLGVVMGFCELTLMGMEAENPFRDNITQIYDAAQRSSNLTHQLLVFARKQATMPILFDLNKTVEKMLKMLRRLINENIELVWVPESGSCIIEMDPSQLDQILANLCINARDAIAEKGTITIKTGKTYFDADSAKSYMDCEPGYYVQISVADDGSGMDKETAQRVFEPFFTTKGMGQGTGLGLSTVYGIIKQNHGFVNLHSEPGIGTIFNIFFPLFTDKDLVEQTKDTEVIAYGKGETILLVEDDISVNDMSCKMLEGLGYEILSAATPTKAIELAENNRDRIDLVLTDVIMPEMNGRELIDQLLLIRPDLKYLFMSGYTSDVVLEKGLSEKERKYIIQKPFSLRDIASIIRHTIEANVPQSMA